MCLVNLGNLDYKGGIDLCSDVSHHIDLQVIRLTFSSLLPAFFY